MTPRASDQNEQRNDLTEEMRLENSARIASSEATRTQFLELAQLWLAAAVQVDLRANGKTTWPTSDLKPGEVVRV